MGIFLLHLFQHNNMGYLICDSGGSKSEWSLVHETTVTTWYAQGISPYFLSASQIVALFQTELLPQLPAAVPIDAVYFYGTGLGNTANVAIVHNALQQVFPNTQKIEVQHDLLAAARALCGRQPGIACILGTGANSCFFDGTTIQKNSPGLGYILGDEGSGAYLGKKVVQYYLYQTFDEELMARFDKTFATTRDEILDNTYKAPHANTYLANFTLFLSENRGHYMIENIIEDGLNDFFFTHLHKYSQTWTTQVHFVGSVAFGFKDVIADLTNAYQMTLGNVFKTPTAGLLAYHAQ